MNYIQIPDYAYERMIKTLQQGVDLCYNVDSNSKETERSPFYANGYSRAAMESIIADLNYYKKVGS